MNKRKLRYKRYFRDGHSPPAIEGCPKGGVVLLTQTLLSFDQFRMTKSKEKARADQTAGQGKGLCAEASFGLEFCFLLVKQKEEV
jgi:hypothetical protein